MEYHLAPEFKYPYQLHKVEALLTWLANNGKARGVDPSRICIASWHTDISGITHALTHGELHEHLMHH